MLADSLTSITGVVLYRGPSLIDNSTPIMAIATMSSTNRKTGNMIQTWIMRSDIEPHKAVRLNQDAPICGDCPLSSGKGCYVVPHHAPLGIFRAFHRGSYPDYNRASHLDLFRNRELRIGAYGDPVAVPYRVWRPLVDVSSGHAGYTHQWRDGRFWRFRKLVMASVETRHDAMIAKRRGWRYFRSTTETKRYANGKDTTLLLSGEILCPAERIGTKCSDCLACNGRRNWKDQRVNIVITAHGSPATLSSYRNAIGGAS